LEYARHQIFYSTYTEDEEHRTGSDRLLKWFNQLEDSFYTNPLNTFARMKPQDEPVKFQSAYGGPFKKYVLNIFGPF
jgi:hypothetical protein